MRLGLPEAVLRLAGVVAEVGRPDATDVQSEATAALRRWARHSGRLSSNIGGVP